MKKGFTLVELMAVIVVLAIIALIATPNIISSISRYNKKMYETQLENIKSAAHDWASDTITKRHCLICVPENNLSATDCSNGGEGCIEAGQDSGRSVSVFLAELIDDGFIGDKKDELQNPKTKEPFSRCLEVVITIDVDTGDYIYSIPNPDESGACSL